MGGKSFVNLLAPPFMSPEMLLTCPLQVGAAKYREMRMKGQTPLPKPVILPQGQDIQLPSRDSNRTIPCRLLEPSSGSSKGVILHIHGGGWVLMSEKASDPLLNIYAQTSHCTVISVGYRLAPEHPFPAGPEDCFDVAEYLVKNGEKEYGGPLRFMGGEVCDLLFTIISLSGLQNTPSIYFSGKDVSLKLRDFNEGLAHEQSQCLYIT